MEKSIKYIIFGAGLCGKSFYKKMKDKIDIVGFSDNNESLWGNVDIGNETSILCMAPEKIEKDVTVIVTVAPVYYLEISKQLQKLQLKCVSVDRFVYNYFAESIKYVEDCLEDDKSKKIFRQVLDCRANGDFSGIKTIRSPEQYFAIPEFVNFSGTEIFVDAGSYCGDVLDVYINSRCGLFKRIYAFEPGKKQFAALKFRTDRLRKEWALEEDKIICVNAAVSDYDGSSCFNIDNENIATSRIGMAEYGGDHIPVHKLDSFLKNGVDFIKADIEGQEMALLRGGVKVIQKYRPRLAICLYHTPFDMFEIPTYIKEIVPEYKLKIRHHSYNTSETVLYAY